MDNVGRSVAHLFLLHGDDRIGGTVLQGKDSEERAKLTSPGYQMEKLSKYRSHIIVPTVCRLLPHCALTLSCALSVDVAFLTIYRGVILIGSWVYCIH